MQLELSFDNLSGACGVSILYNFADAYYSGSIEDRDFLGGAWWTSAGFINTKDCKNYYEEFKKHLQIVYQTPVRKNKNSGNAFIFVIYDGKVPVKNINKSNFEYPWSDNGNA